MIYSYYFWHYFRIAEYYVYLLEEVEYHEETSVIDDERYYLIRELVDRKWKFMTHINVNSSKYSLKLVPVDVITITIEMFRYLYTGELFPTVSQVQLFITSVLSRKHINGFRYWHIQSVHALLQCAVIPFSDLF